MRIWYQSFTDWQHHGAYLERLTEHLRAIAQPGTEVTVAGLTPADLAVHRIGEMRCAVQVFDQALLAQEEGYDAFVIGHFQDSGLDEVRAALDIPVIGMGECSMLYALTLGRRFGLVTIDALFVPLHEEQVARISLADRLVGVETIEASPRELIAAFGDRTKYERLLDVFRVRAGRLVAARAEVVIPAGGLFALLSAGEQKFRVDGAVVLNPIAVTVRAAETAAWLRDLDGTEASRVGVYARPPAQAVQELRALARGLVGTARPDGERS